MQIDPSMGQLPLPGNANINQVYSYGFEGEKESEQGPFSSKYSLSMWDRLSLAVRIEKDFENVN